MNRLQKFEQHRSIFDGNIKATYKNYQGFMNCDNLPNFRIKYVDSKADKTIQYSAQVDLYVSPILLFVDINGFNTKNLSTKGVLYHEFTHIYDYVKTRQMLSEKDTRFNLRLYSEYHATQIETLAAYNLINNIDEPLKNFYSKELTDHLSNTLNRELDMFVNTTEVYKNNITFANFERLKVSYAYLIGILQMYNFISHSSLKTPKFIYDEAFSEMAQLLMEYKHNEFPTKAAILQIGKCNMDSDIRFINTFPDK